MKHPLKARLVAAMLLALSLAAFGQAAPPAAAAVSAAEEMAAARHGAEWMTLLQEPSGELASFGGDWSMISLASVGINAADVRLSPAEPSAQDFYLSLWNGEPPALFSATDFERAILAGYSGGLEPSRLDAQTNLLADLAAQFNGHELGERGATNADVFGVLALSAVGAPGVVIDTLVQTVRQQQDSDGGWNFAAGTKKSEADLTGAALAALCTAGVPSTDPAIAKAESYLHTVQDTITGGFINPTVNTDSTAWVVSGLDACKIDPQAAEWTTAEGKTPIDFLLAQQNEDGSFQRHAHDEEEDFYATQDAVRALSGTGFIAPPPPRKEAGQPAIRPASTVMAGTPVPMTLVIDSAGHVTGGSSVRMCKVIAPVGGTVAQMLQAASEASLPSYCISDLSLLDGRIARVNGVSAEPGKTAWEISREGGAGELQSAGTVGLGALVELRLIPDSEIMDTPAQSPPAKTSTVPTTTGTTAGAAHISKPPRLQVRVGPLTRIRHGRLAVKVRCLAKPGSAGCAGVVRVRVALRARRGRPVRGRVVGEGEVHIAAGASGTVTIELSHSLLKALRSRDDRVAWIVAAMRDPSTSASTSTVLR
ncbi:MAG TPA: prenyltransferase/squalene oxidase repeat-containing protein [Solirubrobacteraceae bacterium]|nr:prenyltransferase/squalene oxidase repeat-containing protein [Solirubrobacteraceae bacterium]